MSEREQTHDHEPRPGETPKEGKRQDQPAREKKISRDEAAARMGDLAAQMETVESRRGDRRKSQQSERYSTSSGGGGGMEDRIGNLEKDVGQLKVDVASIKSRLDSELPHLATKADMAEVRTEIHGMSNRLVMWSVGTIIAGGVLVFAILEYFSK